MTNCDNRSSHASDRDIDNAILSALAASNGQPVPWAALRKVLPESRFWSPIEALCRLQGAGQIEATKINGKTWVAAPLTVSTAA